MTQAIKIASFIFQ